MKRLYRILLISLLAALILFFAASRAVAPQPRAEGRIIVAATIFPLADWLREICGPEAEVLCLVSGSANAHLFDPTTRDALRISQARALFAIGLGFDSWAAKLVQHSGRGNQLACFETGTWITPIKMYTGNAEGALAPGASDPHYWLDPARADMVVSRMAQELSLLDPVHRKIFQQRAAAYMEKLRALDEELAAKARMIPPGAQLVTFHAGYGYLLELLKIKLAAVVQSSPGIEPSLKDLAEALRILRENKQTVVFQEPQESAAAAKTLAAELHARVETLDPMECEIGEGKTYLERLRHDLNVLVEAVSKK